MLTGCLWNSVIVDTLIYTRETRTDDPVNWCIYVTTPNHWSLVPHICIIIFSLVWCLAYIDGLVQEIRNSSALAMELCLYCTNPWSYVFLTLTHRYTNADVSFIGPLHLRQNSIWNWTIFNEVNTVEKCQLLDAGRFVHVSMPNSVYMTMDNGIWTPTYCVVIQLANSFIMSCPSDEKSSYRLRKIPEDEMVLGCHFLTYPIRKEKFNALQDRFVMRVHFWHLLWQPCGVWRYFARFYLTCSQQAYITCC